MRSTTSRLRTIHSNLQAPKEWYKKLEGYRLSGNFETGPEGPELED